MIGYLQGKVYEWDLETLILLVNGVGYELNCSTNTIDVASSDKSEVSLYIYTHVREDAFHLFGFISKQEKQLFLALIKVNGIGPKMAIKILSAAPLNQLIKMIEEEDAKGLSKLPKVGKKTAEQMILTLKGKLVSAEADKNLTLNINDSKKDIHSALVNLGFRPQDVEKIVSTMDGKIEVTQGIREGLRMLSSTIDLNVI